jgi:hypothetical protein
MIYIQTIHSITHQNSFNQENVWNVIGPLQKDSLVVAPDYKNFIPLASLRRLSPILRMALTAAKACQASISEEIDAISVGTALGCLTDTEKFLVTFHNATGDAISPTSFIQSTHNTIAGLISLDLKNHSYNMTHTQNSLSFETAMMDAIMCCKEGKNHVLLGAADEAIDFLQLLQPLVIDSDLQLTSGATFMILGPENTESGIGILGLFVDNDVVDIIQTVNYFLQQQGLSLQDIDHFFVSGDDLVRCFPGATDYLSYSGFYYSASAFAFHLGHDWLKKEKKNYVLIINEQVKGKAGIILLKRDEAQA